MTTTASDSRGYGTPKQIRQYAANLSERGLRRWYRQGLEHIRLPNGRVLIAFEAVDRFLERYAVTKTKLDEIVDEVVSELES